MSRKRWIWLLAGAVVGVALLAWSMRDQLAYARMATAFAAKQTCSCLHVSGRSVESCLADLPDDARSALTVADDGQFTRASVLLGAVSARARFEENYGCRLEN